MDIKSLQCNVSFHQGTQDYKKPNLCSQQTLEKTIWRCWAVWSNKVPFLSVQKAFHQLWGTLMLIMIFVVGFESSLKVTSFEQIFLWATSSTWPCNPETSLTAFRPYGFNEPPFQLEVLQSSDGNLWCFLWNLLLPEQPGPNRIQL